MQFSPDGTRLATASADDTARLWSVPSLEVFIERLRARLTRNLTLDEWSDYLPNQPYRTTCPNLPLALPD